MKHLRRWGTNSRPILRSSEGLGRGKKLDRMAKEAGIKSRKSTEKMRETTEKMKETAEKMKKEGAEKMHRVTSLMMAGNAAAVQSLASKSGEQMISAFLLQSLRSAKSRREQTSSAASELAQTLVLQHSRALIDPLYASAQTLVGSIGMKIFESTIDVIVAFVLRRVYAVKALALSMVTCCSDAIDAVIPAPLEALVSRHGGWAAKRALQVMVTMQRHPMP